mgnify:CR=1 FL=1|jgi:hypothetical protein
MKDHAISLSKPWREPARAAIFDDLNPRAALHPWVSARVQPRGDSIYHGTF